jgi:hypothetical protein
LAGEAPAELRRVIAYLVFDKRADVTRDGSRLTEVSAARHRRRAGN